MGKLTAVRLVVGLGGKNKRLWVVGRVLILLSILLRFPLPITQHPRLLPLFQLHNIPQEIVRLPLRHIAEQSGLQHVLQSVKPRLIIFPEKSHRLLVIWQRRIREWISRFRRWN